MTVMWICDLSPGFTQVLSTIKSPVFSDIVVIYEDGSICGTHRPGSVGCWVRSYDSFMKPVIDNLHQMRKILDFGLVLCADVRGYEMGYTVGKPEWDVSRQWEQLRLGNFSRVSVTSSPRRSGHSCHDPLHPSFGFYHAGVVPPL